MKTLNNSLRCLSHPVTMASIALLLVNDHVLKNLYPSWVTGKLSDFAGLFFFPFVFAAALSIVFARARFSARTVGVIAFSITGIWFGLMKTTGWGNALTQDFLSRVFGFPVRIVLDPTDVIALASLLPTWVLWNRPTSALGTNRLGWVALVVATLASVATSPAPPPPFIVAVSSVGDTLCIQSRQKPELYESTNGGFTWTSVTRSSCEFQKPTLPKIICSPSNRQLCYRIDQKEQVEKSVTGGETWTVAWNIPPGRRRFIEQRTCGINILACNGKTIDMGPYDIAFATHNGAEIVVVAMGNEGVLVLDRLGFWNRYGVGAANPTPLASIDPIVAFQMTWNETVWLTMAAFAAFPLLSILTWVIVSLRLIRDNARARLLGVFTPALGVVAIGAALFGLHSLAPIQEMIRAITKDETLATIYYVVVLIGIPSLFLAGFASSWYRLSQIIAEPRKVGAAVGLIIAVAISIFPLGWMPLYSWVIGIIDYYEIALRLTIGLEVILLGVFVFAVVKLGWVGTSAK